MPEANLQEIALSGAVLRGGVLAEISGATNLTSRWYPTGRMPGKYSFLRLLSFVLYVVGAVSVSIVLIVKIALVAAFICRNSGWTLF